MTNATAIDPKETLKRLTNDEKAKLLSGEDMWHTAPIPRLGIPRVRMSDGPNGVRGTAWTNAAPASCFPCATALAASFDIDLLERVGVALGKECRARGVHCLLGPTTNIHRHPCGGRGFESFSEDPCLSGTMASAWIRGVQSQDVMTTPKHFVANEQEHCRRSNNSIIDLRTLHEIYLEPFRLQMKEKPTVFMSSYNRVNGIHAAEDPYLLRDILRRDWGFSGMVMSDWSGTYSSAGAIKAGLDLEMPGPTMMRGMCIDRDLVSGKLRPSDVDECVLRVLEFVRQAQLSGIPFDAKEETIDDPRVRQTMLDAARAGVVLLKNDTNALPLSIESSTKIAVVGYNAKHPSNTGGGSANLATTYLTSPLEELKKVATQCSATVEYAMGVDASRWTPLLTPYLGLPGGLVGKGHCVECTFYTEDPWVADAKPDPVFQLKNNNAFTYFIDGIPGSVPVRGYVSLKTDFVPDQSGKWELGLGVAGQADLYMNGERVIENSENQEPDILFFNTGSKERTCVVEVEQGVRYEMEVRFSNFKQINSLSPYAGRRGGIRIGGRALRDPKALIQEAVTLAERSDVTIAVVGTTPEWESEGYDRTDMSLPPGTDDLIAALLSTKRNVIVVNQSGMPVRLPWIDQAPTFVQALFGGNEGGQALVDVLTGRYNPSGKLPFSWGAKEEDYPSHNSFGQTYDSVYEEGLEVGYRYFDGTTPERTPLFPFGHGLSYTQFQYSSVLVKPTEFGCTVTLSITNVGKLEGAESCQVYVHANGADVVRPKLELGGFAKVALQPGETKKVSVELDHKAFSFYDTAKLKWRAQRGSYEIRVGRSAFDIVASAPFLLGKTFVWKGLDRPTAI